VTQTNLTDEQGEKGMRTTLSLVSRQKAGWLDKQTSAKYKSSLWFGLDKQHWALVLNFNISFSISNGCGHYPDSYRDNAIPNQSGHKALPALYVICQ